MELVVPWALDPTERLIEPTNAEKGLNYRCPECKVALRLRGGTAKVRVHFAHPPGSGCSKETIIHAAAKQSILRTVRAWLKEGGPAPTLVTGCPGTTWWSCEWLHMTPLRRTKVDAVSLEWRLESGLRPDVVLFKGQCPILGIEIHVTHAVSEEKAARVEIPWIEMEAESVLRQPIMWYPAKFSQSLNSKLGGELCKFCRSIEEGAIKALLEKRVHSPEVLRAPWNHYHAFEKDVREVFKAARAAWVSAGHGNAPWVTLRMGVKEFTAYANRHWGQEKYWSHR